MAAKVLSWRLLTLSSEPLEASTSGCQQVPCQGKSVHQHRHDRYSTKFADGRRTNKPEEDAMNTFNDFNDGLKINNDLDNRKERPHFDIMTDLRREIRGIEKVRIDPNGNVMNGETVVGPIKMPW